MGAASLRPMLIAFVAGLATSTLPQLVSVLSNTDIVAGLLAFLITGAVPGVLKGSHWLPLFLSGSLGTAAGLPIGIAPQDWRMAALIVVYILIVGALPAIAGLLAAKILSERLWSTAAAGLLLPSVIVVGLSLSTATDLKRKPDDVVRQLLLEEAPLGSTMQEVARVVERHDWETRRVDDSRGFFHQRVQPSREVGSRHIEAYAGNYSVLFRTDASVYWGFDTDGRLIDVWV